MIALCVGIVGFFAFVGAIAAADKAAFEAARRPAKEKLEEAHELQYGVPHSKCDCPRCVEGRRKQR